MGIPKKRTKAKPKSSASKPKAKSSKPKGSKKKDAAKPPETEGEKLERVLQKVPANKRKAARALAESGALVSDDLMKLVENGDKQGLEKLKEIVTAFNGEKSSSVALKRVVREQDERVKSERKTLESRIEDPLPAGKPSTLALEKLKRIEMAYQDVKEAEAQAVEEKRDAKKTHREWAKRLDTALKNSAQLALPGVT